MKPGAYQVDALVVVQHRAEAPIPLIDGLTAGLLIGAPSPEGRDVSEVGADDYERQPITFTPTSKAAFRSSARVTFAPVLAWSEVRFLGLFKPDGELLASGRLKTSPGPTGHDELTFAVSSIRLCFTNPSG